MSRREVDEIASLATFAGGEVLKSMTASDWVASACVRRAMRSSAA
jgi:hypothetical protein